MIPQAKGVWHTLLLSSCLALALSGCAQEPPDNESQTELGPSTPTTPSAAAATNSSKLQYIGSESCKDCHADAFSHWQTSQHAKAIQVADETTVLGDFNNAKATSHGQDFSFTTRDGEFLVNSHNKEGDAQEFTISHTFGLEPLQQYLVEFPNGAKQALSMAWDTRPQAQGGQQWFHLYSDEPITPQDSLHWTRRQQNWNHQCADCHSTNVKKNASLNEAADGIQFNTQFDELSVGCEACHGPASAHISWADEASENNEIKNDDAAFANTFTTSKGFSASLTDTDTQLFSCARCHSRRQQIAEGFVPGNAFYDYYIPALLTEGLYHSDGQINDEVYVYGSFVQSKMHRAGVICSDCHNTHSTKLKLPGNAVCTQCHSPQGAARFEGLEAKHYDAIEHTLHATGSDGAQCRNCHMPAKTYMGNDIRFDHSFRIPRPGLSEQNQAPDACTSCHQDKTAAWATEVIEDKYQGSQAASASTHFSSAFNAAREQNPAAAPSLVNIADDPLQASIVRSTALAMTGQFLSPPVLAAAERALQSTAPDRQLAALQAIENLPSNELWPRVAPLLSDPILAVRAHAGRVLAGAPAALLDEKQRTSLANAVEEYKNTQLLHPDRPETWSNLGILAARQNNNDVAQSAYRQALQLDPQWIPAYLNLADLHRAQDKEAEAGAVLQQAIATVEPSAEVHHAYGLWLSRAKRTEDALAELRKATELAPSNWRHRYVYAIGLNSSGNSAQAISELKLSLESAAGNPDILYALAAIHRDTKDIDEAIAYLRQLLALYPGHRQAQALLKSVL